MICVITIIVQPDGGRGERQLLPTLLISRLWRPPTLFNATPAPKGLRPWSHRRGLEATSTHCFIFSTGQKHRPGTENDSLHSSCCEAQVSHSGLLEYVSCWHNSTTCHRVKDQFVKRILPWRTGVWWDEGADSHGSGESEECTASCILASWFTFLISSTQRNGTFKEFEGIVVQEKEIGSIN